MLSRFGELLSWTPLDLVRLPEAPCRSYLLVLVRALLPGSSSWSSLLPHGRGAVGLPLRTQALGALSFFLSPGLGTSLSLSLSQRSTCWNSAFCAYKIAVIPILAICRAKSCFQQLEPAIAQSRDLAREARSQRIPWQ